MTIVWCVLILWFGVPRAQSLYLWNCLVQSLLTLTNAKNSHHVLIHLCRTQQLLHP